MSNQIISEIDNTVIDSPKRKNIFSKATIIAVIIIVIIVLAIIGLNAYGKSNQKLAEEYVKNTVEYGYTLNSYLNNLSDDENEINIDVKTKFIDKNKHNNLYVIDVTVDEKNSSNTFFYIVHIEENNNYFVHRIQYDETNRSNKLKEACSYLYILNSQQQ